MKEAIIIIRKMLLLWNVKNMEKVNTAKIGLRKENNLSGYALVCPQGVLCVSLAISSCIHLKRSKMVLSCQSPCNILLAYQSSITHDTFLAYAHVDTANAKCHVYSNRFVWSIGYEIVKNLKTFHDK